jgi:hypothetical protein
MTEREVGMCLTCGCMDAHREMGEHNFTYEDLIVTRTAAKDKETHAQEYKLASQ